MLGSAPLSSVPLSWSRQPVVFSAQKQPLRYGQRLEETQAWKSIQPALAELETNVPNDKQTYVQNLREKVEIALRGWEALVYKKNQELRHLKKASITDVLTGLPNRQFFQQHMEDSFAQSQRDKMPLSLILLDLDKLKSINDQFGHEGGDIMLKLFSRIVQKHVRRNERPSRIGGEEFAMVMENTSPREAQAVARRINTKVGECLSSGTWKEFLKEDPVEDKIIAEAILKKLGLTVSAGLVTYEPGQSDALIPDARQLMSLADVGLYLCKGAPIANKWISVDTWKNMKGSRNRVYQLDISENGKVTPKLLHVGKSAADRGVTPPPEQSK